MNWMRILCGRIFSTGLSMRSVHVLQEIFFTETVYCVRFSFPTARHPDCVAVGREGGPVLVSREDRGMPDTNLLERKRLPWHLGRRVPAFEAIEGRRNLIHEAVS